jgi:hypothetical protein
MIARNLIRNLPCAKHACVHERFNTEFLEPKKLSTAFGVSRYVFISWIVSKLPKELFGQTQLYNRKFKTCRQMNGINYF